MVFIIQCGSSGFTSSQFPAEGGIWFSSLWMWAWLSDSLLMNRMQQVDAVWPPRLHSKEGYNVCSQLPCCEDVQALNWWNRKFVYCFLSLQGTCTLWEQGSTWNSCSPPVFSILESKSNSRNCGPNHMIFFHLKWWIDPSFLVGQTTQFLHGWHAFMSGFIPISIQIQAAFCLALHSSHDLLGLRPQIPSLTATAMLAL